MELIRFLVYYKSDVGLIKPSFHRSLNFLPYTECSKKHTGLDGDPEDVLESR